MMTEREHFRGGVENLWIQLANLGCIYFKLCTLCLLPLQCVVTITKRPSHLESKIFIDIAKQEIIITRKIPFFHEFI